MSNRLNSTSDYARLGEFLLKNLYSSAQLDLSRERANLSMPENLMPNIRVELGPDIVSAVIEQAESPALEHLSRVAVSLRVVGSGNPGLKQLPKHLRRVERQTAGIFLRHQRARRGVSHSRPDRSALFSEVPRIGFQQMRKESIDEKTRRNLVCLGRTVSLRIRSPALAIVRLRIGGLRQRRLQHISEMGLEIFHLLKGIGIFLTDGERRSVVGSFERRKIWLDPENDFNRFILEYLARYRWFLLLPPGSRISLRCRRIRFLLGTQSGAPEGQRQRSKKVAYFRIARHYVHAENAHSSRRTGKILAKVLSSVY